MKLIKSDFLRALAISLFAVISGFQALKAIPADPRPRTVTQPDGSTVVLRMVGDERGHFYVTDDRRAVVVKDNAYYYAELDAAGNPCASNILVKDASKLTDAQRSYVERIDQEKVYGAFNRRISQSQRGQRAPQRGPGLFPGSDFPTKGSPRVLVIMVSYKNLDFTLTDPYDYFSRMLTEQGFDDYGGTGSALDYFRENSMGQFTPQIDLYGPVQLSKNMNYYGGNDWSGNDQNPEKMAIEACQLLDDTVDFSVYDNDNDGYIDNVYIFYAGKGEASYGSADTVWPHAWNVTAATSTPYIFDGVRLDRYACSNEWESSRPDGIGTFVHEFSHVMGIPDLYATSYTSAFTPGAYSAMDSGPYNNDGRTPPAYGAFERYALDWMTPIEVDGPANIKLKEIQSSNKAYIIHTEKENEYFLIENRQQTGWDAYIPGHGMLVWHIDYDDYAWSSNTVNNTASHQYVDIEEADNDRSEYTRDGDPFPGRNNITEFTDDTKPSMKSWSGHKLGLPITEIAENAGMITARVAGGLPLVYPVQLSEATDITTGSFKIEWTVDSNATSYRVSVYQKLEAGDRVIEQYAQGWSKADVGLVNSITVDRLQPGTLYNCVVYASNGEELSEASNEITVETLPPTFDMLCPVALMPDSIYHDSFVAVWTELAGATDYILNVFTRQAVGDPFEDTCGFDNGVTNLPDGWKSSSRQSYANAAYSGAAVPSLRLSTAEAYVQSPVYDDGVCGLRFWHRGSSVAPTNTIRVMALVDNQWVNVAVVDIVTAAGGATTTINELPEGTASVRIVYNEDVHKGSVAIDDITVLHGQGVVNVPLGIYSDFHTGNVLSHTVEGAESQTTYYYTIAAFDGSLTSLTSDPVCLTTKMAPAGVFGVTANAVAITAAGTTVRVNGAASAPVMIYDLSGRLIYSGSTGKGGTLTVDLKCRGVYIVRVADKASKISL